MKELVQEKMGELDELNQLHENKDLSEDGNFLKILKDLKTGSIFVKIKKSITYQMNILAEVRMLKTFFD